MHAHLFHDRVTARCIGDPKACAYAPRMGNNKEYGKRQHARGHGLGDSDGTLKGWWPRFAGGSVEDESGHDPQEFLPLLSDQLPEPSIARRFVLLDPSVELAHDLRISPILASELIHLGKLFQH